MELEDEFDHALEWLLDENRTNKVKQRETLQDQRITTPLLTSLDNVLV